MSDTFRDSTVGVFINILSGGRYLPYPDQRPGWTVPESFLVNTASSSATATFVSEKRDPTVPTRKPSREDITEESQTPARLSEDGPPVPESRRTSLSYAEKGGKGRYSVNVNMVREETIQDTHSGTVIVDWYNDHDPDNPKNWSLNKRLFVLGLISLLTFSVYIGSAIYTPSIPGIMEHFDVSKTTATLGLSLYVIGYGIGPLIFSPLSEIPSIGRTPIYMATLLIFALLQLPTIFAPNIQTLLAMRFFAGFFGSPALATGGASIQDMFPMVKLPYALISWAIAALCGPVLGPTIGGFAAMKETWRWPIWELFWIASAAFAILVFWLPETYAETILLKRARRLRALTGNPNLFSESEIKQSQMKTSEVLFEALLRPIQLMFEPAVLYANIYIGLAYAIFYLWFEAFPLVYNDIYHFNLGLSGLPFLGLMVSGIITSLGYVAWNYYRVEPEYRRTGKIIPESRLGVALFASAFIPLSLFMFGWTSRASIHWIVPTIGAALYLPGLFLLFQSVLVYLPSSYPKYAASILAGNDLFRSTVAGCFPLFGTPLYHRLTIGGGCSMLAGLSIALIPGLWILYKYGDRLRARSKYIDPADL
ncbi:Caffeine resistance protein 5 [Psilocybe cubensis]|uniref:Major facilitator superfamily (MFS) profile domain-containing protein n=2 Tax=Psilocybe cubensis TaxID=181762 RepID=A0A8H7XL79_PSICU|nr:Caffeine resistance protein 5 [Psilocybe cubensis]KAH9477538.1 Caffeine resistance protein 5 [Psilocybe cubensis]